MFNAIPTEKKEGRRPFPQRGKKPTLQARAAPANLALQLTSSSLNRSAASPVGAELPHQIQRTDNEDGVFRCGLRHCVFEGLLGFGNYGKAARLVSGNFGEPRGGKSARRARSSKENFRGVGKEQAGDFVNGFVP